MNGARIRLEMVLRFRVLVAAVRIRNVFNLRAIKRAINGLVLIDESLDFELDEAGPFGLRFKRAFEP